jgi:hypothetical protein
MRSFRPSGRFVVRSWRGWEMNEQSAAANADDVTADSTRSTEER